MATSAAPTTDGATRSYPVSEAESADLTKRFTYHSPQEDQLPRYARLRSLALGFAMEIARAVPPGRERALALTKLEECVMHANSGIARETR